MESSKRFKSQPEPKNNSEFGSSFGISRLKGVKIKPASGPMRSENTFTLGRKPPSQTRKNIPKKPKIVATQKSPPEGSTFSVGRKLPSQTRKNIPKKPKIVPTNSSARNKNQKFNIGDRVLCTDPGKKHPDQEFTINKFIEIRQPDGTSKIMLRANEFAFPLYDQNYCTLVPKNSSTPPPSSTSTLSPFAAVFEPSPSVQLKKCLSDYSSKMSKISGGARNKTRRLRKRK
jgi:hypothetical protein